MQRIYTTKAERPVPHSSSKQITSKYEVPSKGFSHRQQPRLPNVVWNTHTDASQETIDLIIELAPQIIQAVPKLDNIEWTKDNSIGDFIKQFQRLTKAHHFEYISEEFEGVENEIRLYYEYNELIIWCIPVVEVLELIETHDIKVLFAQMIRKHENEGSVFSDNFTPKQYIEFWEEDDYYDTDYMDLVNGIKQLEETIYKLSKYKVKGKITPMDHFEEKLLKWIEVGHDMTYHVETTRPYDDEGWHVEINSMFLVTDTLNGVLTEWVEQHLNETQGNSNLQPAYNLVAVTKDGVIRDDCTDKIKTKGDWFNEIHDIMELKRNQNGNGNKHN